MGKLKIAPPSGLRRGLTAMHFRYRHSDTSCDQIQYEFSASSASAFLRVSKVLLFRSNKKGPAEADPVIGRMIVAGYLLSSTRDAIMLYDPALTKMRPRTRTVLAFTGVTFRLVPLTIETAMVD